MELVKIKMWRSSGGNNVNRHKKSPGPAGKEGSLWVPEKSATKGSAPGDEAALVRRELETLVGLGSVKNHIKEIDALIEIQKRRAREKLYNESQALHMVFKGNPGTGKTTVARIIGKLFKESGILPKGHLQEVERADLVGEYIGHTAQKTREQIKKSLGGILFIDEAYALARGGEKDFGKEAIDTLVRSMEDQRNNLIIILAGYRHEMERFMQTNPGLRSRFPIHITFPDYSTEELIAIADLMLEQKEYRLSHGARMELINAIEMCKLNQHHGNARMVRNLIERAIRVQALRLVQLNGKTTREDLMTITRDDMLKARDSISN